MKADDPILKGIVRHVVSTLANKGHAFTSFDVTRHVRHNHKIYVEHKEVSQLVRDLHGDGEITNQNHTYIVTFIDIRPGVNARVWHPITVDAQSYNPDNFKHLDFDREEVEIEMQGDEVAIPDDLVQRARLNEKVVKGTNVGQTIVLHTLNMQGENTFSTINKKSIIITRQMLDDVGILGSDLLLIRTGNIITVADDF